MYRRLFHIMLWLIISTQADAGIQRWDALPAIDVMHLQGPYAGKEVCPVCRHGYDAGVLMFLPSNTSPENAARIARVLQTTVAHINDNRFRPFLILTGAAPSQALLAAVKSTNANWYVAHLATQALPAASKDYELPLHGKSVAYVFSQRRLLWTFNPEDSNALWTKTLTKYADYAMTFLHSNYATPVKSGNPDTPKGRLWMAPTKLSTRLALTTSKNKVESRVCISNSVRSPRNDSLIALTSADPASPKRTWWARTDSAGCLVLSGMQNGLQLHAEIFSVLQPSATTRIDGKDLQRGKLIEIKLPSSDAMRVTGSEVVVGLPCEGCEWVFQGLPTRFASAGRVAPASEPGEPLSVSGTVKNSAGIPQANIIVYAYQTDRLGSYPKDTEFSTRHGRLRGWVRTDSAGRYSFNTIRPGSYPGEDTPQHIHLHIIEPGRCTYTVGDILFVDDPLLSAAHRSKERNAHGGSGIVKAEGNKNMGWRVIRNITLGLNVPGYTACANNKR